LGVFQRGECSTGNGGGVGGVSRGRLADRWSGSGEDLTRMSVSEIVGGGVPRRVCAPPPLDVCAWGEADGGVCDTLERHAAPGG